MSKTTDIDLDRCKTIEQVVDSAKIVRRDVNDVDFDELRADYGPIDGLVFGFPCNDFSVVGERRGIEGEYGGLYKFGVNGLLKLQPKFFVAENVSGLPGQPNHPRVQEFEAAARSAVHAAGKRMADDAMDSARAANLFMEARGRFCEEGWLRGRAALIAYSSIRSSKTDTASWLTRLKSPSFVTNRAHPYCNAEAA